MAVTDPGTASGARLARIGSIRVWLLLAAILAPFGTLHAQTPPGSPAPDPPADRIRVFLDCEGTACDFDHVRRVITFVDWVRDPNDSDVHVFVTSVPTGAGTQFDLLFLGVNRFAGEGAELSVPVPNTDTDTERREALARAIRVGLVPYVSRSSEGNRIDVVYHPDGAGGAVTDPRDDPWNYWVFTVSGSGQYATEASTEGATFEGAIDVSRTTEALKLRIAAGTYYTENTFDFEGRSFKSIARANEASLLLGVSLGERFSLGFKGDLWSSTFTNTREGARGAIAAELNLFPYAESTRRELTLLYTVGTNRLAYHELTIYNRLLEYVYDHSLLIDLVLKQPWGSVNTSLVGRQHLDDPEQYRVTASANLNFRVFRGLSLGISSGYEAIRDQIFLARRGATTEEVFLQRKTLATDFRFYSQLGLSFTFGSIFNNVVNPRLNALRRYRN